MNDFGAILHDTPLVDPATPVLLPGERELRRMAQARETGFYVDSESVARLRQMLA